MVALGVSAISAVNGTYSQNQKTLTAYYAGLDLGALPVARGAALSPDDVLRRSLIGQLMCNFALPYAALQLPDGVTFADCFGPELLRLRELEADGLLVIGPDGLLVTPKGRLLIRNICMVFDSYLALPRPVADARVLRFSRTI